MICAEDRCDEYNGPCMAVAWCYSLKGNERAKLPKGLAMLSDMLCRTIASTGQRSSFQEWRAS